MRDPKSCLCYYRIEVDQRHQNVIKLIDEPITKKSFAQWFMGFAVTDAEKTSKLVGYLKSISELDLSSDSNGTIAIKTFVESNGLKINY